MIRFMTQILLASLIVLVPTLIVAVALASWLCAKPRPATFSLFVQGGLSAFAKTCEPAWVRAHCVWLWLGPRITARPLWMAAFADIGTISGGQPALQFLASHPIMFVGLVAVNLFTPLAVDGAPPRIPSPAQRAALVGAH